MPARVGDATESGLREQVAAAQRFRQGIVARIRKEAEAKATVRCETPEDLVDRSRRLLAEGRKLRELGGSMRPLRRSIKPWPRPQRRRHHQRAALRANRAWQQMT